MKRQPAPAYISPVWFFTKIGIICVLGVIVGVQMYSMFWKSTPVPQVSRVVVTSSKAGKDKQLPQPKRDQPKQAQAKKVDTQDASPKQTEKPALTKALMNPETYAMIKDEFKRRLDAPYGKLYRELGLEKETLQKLRNMLAEKELSLAEGFRLASEAGTPLSTESLAALRADADGPIKELLGDEAYANYKYYESTLPARNHANILGSRLSYNTEPLTKDQYNALVSALSVLPEQNIKLGSGAWLGNHTIQLSKESLEIARGILTPSQFAVYEEEYAIMILAQGMEEKYSQNTSIPKKKTVNNKKKK